MTSRGSAPGGSIGRRRCILLVSCFTLLAEREARSRSLGRGQIVQFRVDWGGLRGLMRALSWAMQRPGRASTDADFD